MVGVVYDDQKAWTWNAGRRRSRWIPVTGVHGPCVKISNANPSSLTVLGLGVVALLLVLASTGGAVAGSLITGKKIKDGTITSADIKNRTLKSNDLSPAAVKTLRGRPGDRGPAGASGTTGPQGTAGPAGSQGTAGPAGPQGERGPAGPKGLTSVRNVTGPMPSSATEATGRVFCDPEEIAIGGGVIALHGQGGAVPALAASQSSRGASDGPMAPGSGWEIRVRNQASTGTVSATIFVLCAAI